MFSPHPLPSRVEPELHLVVRVGKNFTVVLSPSDTWSFVDRGVEERKLADQTPVQFVGQYIRIDGPNELKTVFIFNAAKCCDRIELMFRDLDGNTVCRSFQLIQRAD